MDAVSYINKTYTIISDISPKNYTKLARNNIDGKLYVLKFIKVYDISIYSVLKNNKIQGISNIYEIIESPNGLYVVEEYIDGVTLEECFNTVSPEIKKDDLLIKLISQVLDTLSTLHRFTPPIIHRDITPNNIMVDRNGNARLIDFNISRNYTGKSDHDTMAMGTSQFAAPEQYGFLESDTRTDIYGVGATAKYIMIKYGIVSDALEQFVNKAMAFSPNDRFASAGDAKYYLLNYHKIVKEEYKREKGLTGYRRFLPPGYRMGNAFHIIIASLANFIMFVHTYYSIILINKKDSTEKGQYTLAVVIAWLWYISIVGFSFNYLNVQKKFGIDKLSGGKKWIAIIGVDFILIVVIAIIGAFFINIV